MPLVVEDGTIVAGANTYVTLTEVKDVATTRGITFPDDATLEQKVHLAMDWFEFHDFFGDRTDVATPQQLTFPRVGVCLDGITYGDNDIPPLVKAVVIQATLDATIIALEPAPVAASGLGALQAKKLDVMEKRYFKPTWADSQPKIEKLLKMLTPLLANNGLASGRLQVHRV